MATKKNIVRNEIKSIKTKFSLPSWSVLQTINWEETFRFLQDKRFRISLGLALIFFSLFLFFSILSFLFTGKADQSIVENTYTISSGKEIENWLGLWGAVLSHFFIYKLFGISSILFAPFFFLVGYRVQTGKAPISILRAFTFCIFSMTWLSLAMGYFVEVSASHNAFFFLCGNIGLRLAEVFNSFAGIATIFLLILSLAIFLVYFFELTSWSKFKEDVKSNIENVLNKKDTLKTSEQTTKTSQTKVQEPTPPSSSPSISLPIVPIDLEEKDTAKEKKDKIDFTIEKSTQEPDVPTLYPVRQAVPEEQASPESEVVLESAENQSTDERLEDDAVAEVEEYTYDPRLELSNYRPPDLDLLNEVKEDKKIQVTEEELEANVKKIVETLGYFNIAIKSIKATIGPTVTLYEIIPDAGIKISRIRSLEDDIALNLAALGIRIIAPIPGKGTIGIEVPNKNRQIVSLRSILATEKFAHANKELPIALGKTISNDVFITDLTKMPHLLMAGATGQGKSVGLNVIITSLLYKKHPAELKFVMIDPKKVELSLFNAIKQHFLAALPDGEDPIITDTKKAINVLNSLCVEMDSRYNLLKDAGVRNIKEYNTKFIHRRLNPKKGHRYLPYIVLIIDELADLMMVAGKEVELPIARLAQLARAIGIHLVVATQRPSVDVITGIIKANFPARLSFRVTSRIDSRTILDTGGADQLIGMGDMLLSNGSEIIRLQCAYVDTEEVERICEFIGSQQGYPTPYLLPEYSTEEGSEEQTTDDLLERDELFETAARLIVATQQGSTSLLQRKLGIGYNRAGRIMDQLELANIVGPFEGSKPRQLLVQDEYTLEQIFRRLHEMDEQKKRTNQRLL